MLLVVSFYQMACMRLCIHYMKAYISYELNDIRRCLFLTCQLAGHQISMQSSRTLQFVGRPQAISAIAILEAYLALGSFLVMESGFSLVTYLAPCAGAC